MSLLAFYNKIFFNYLNKKNNKNVQKILQKQKSIFE